MVKKRLIPKILVQHQLIGGTETPVMVTTRAFDAPRRVGAPASQARIYEAQLADELIVLNIDRRSLEPGGAMIGLIEGLASESFMPLTIGGGVGTLQDFDLLLSHGADKVAVTTAALDRPALIEEAAKTFGAQCVVVGLDVVETDDGPRVSAERGTRISKFSPLEWARMAVKLGAGELLLTDVSRDGGGKGLNFDLCAEITSAVDVPVILSGGAGLARHFVDGFLIGGAEGVAAGTFFALRDQNPMQARSHIANAGVSIRMLT